MQEEGDPAYSYRGGQGALKVIRGRGCDESFRAAVDVDYNKHLVDPNHRSETSNIRSNDDLSFFKNVYFRCQKALVVGPARWSDRIR